MPKLKSASTPKKSLRLNPITDTISPAVISTPQPIYTDAMLMEDYVECAKYCWGNNLSLFADDCFASHLTIKVPSYHRDIYSALQDLILEKKGGEYKSLQAPPAAPPAALEMENCTPPTSLQFSKVSMGKSHNKYNSNSSEFVEGNILSEINSEEKESSAENISGEKNGDRLSAALKFSKKFSDEKVSDKNNSEKENKLVQEIIPTKNNQDELSEENLEELISRLKHSVVIEPREFGKSTKAMIYVMWALINRYKKFVLYISKSFDHAVKLVGPIKHEFEANEDLKEVYGDLRGDKWTESEMEFRTGAKLLAVGRGQTVRGLKFLNFRPDLVILDDIEDDESVENKELRLKLHEWLDKQVIKGVDSRLGTVSAFGTVLHPDSLLANLSKEKDRSDKYRNFKSLFFGALDSNDRSIWEDKFTTEQLHAERKQDFYSFAQERMNQPIPIGSGMFKREYIKYFYVDDGVLIAEGKEVKLSSCKLFMTTDIALTEKESSDYTVILVAAVSADNDLFVLDYTRERWSDPEKIMNEMFRLHGKYPDAIEVSGVEEVQAQKWLSVALRKEMKKRNKFFNLRALKADKDKLRRIAQLQPRFSNHSVFIKNHMSELEEELLLFPKSSHDDVSDALAYQLQIIVAPDKVEETNKRVKREEYKFGMTGEEVLKRIEDKVRPVGVFKEYMPTESYDPYKEDEFDTAVIQRWDEVA